MSRPNRTISSHYPIEFFVPVVRNMQNIPVKAMFCRCFQETSGLREGCNQPPHFTDCGWSNWKTKNTRKTFHRTRKLPPEIS
ncbi:hypothetical protein JTE90_019876 [Oedothorax gibbosus]|uniref:Uncharacterized protein n=1 Tax=Oedothorax gibbosus TaxID=931172 RepID=A0AAV6VWC2_9ARAC|nr:hypothetical protein JTE90_019876 [Oedothorax gibbosus]